MKKYVLIIVLLALTFGTKAQTKTEQKIKILAQ
jgi:hypothetical protein